MSDRTMNRRRAIRTTGLVALLGLAGCSGNDTQSDGGTATSSSTATATPSSTSAQTTTETETATPAAQDGLRGPRNGDDLPTDTNPNNGYPPEFDTVPREREVDPTTFETLSRSGYQIKLVPTDVAYYWYARGEARFADTRSESEYDVSHVFGSVLSPAGDGRDLPDDPAIQWPKDDRIVTYCDCPHHLSSLRAASLKSRGYEEVYALDEGYSAWRERNFPLAGEDVGRVPPTRVVEGNVPRQYGGETAWAFHTESNQREATRIAADGSYELEIKFVDLTQQSTIRVETPAYSLTGTVRELTNNAIAADGELAGSASTRNTTTSTGSNTTSTGSNTTTTTSAYNLGRERR
jgi:rhodanese-related sulfurtransferase